MITRGIDFGRKVQKALGLEGRQCCRIVIDIPCDGAVKVYFQEFMEDKHQDKVVEAIASCRDVVEVEEVLPDSTLEADEYGVRVKKKP